MGDRKALSVSGAASQKPAKDSGSLMRRAALASVAISLFLVVIKAVAYFASGSVSVLAALADSALDLFTASLNLIAIRSALAPADAEHRFGHGKAEPLAGLAQGAFIAASALFLVIQSTIRLVAPQPLDHATVAFAVMAISIVFAAGLVVYQRQVVALTGSIAISADRLHYMGDLFTNVGVLAAIALATIGGWTRADPVIALVVACFMVASAWHVSRTSYDQLMDRELPDIERDRIKNIVMQHAEVRSLHDLRTRAAGVNTFIQVHIELDPAMSLMRAHEVSDSVEHDLCRAYPRAEVIIHQDPAGVEMPAELAQT